MLDEVRAAHGLQLHRLRRVLVRDRRRADPAHEPHEHARAARRGCRAATSPPTSTPAARRSTARTRPGPEEHAFLAVNSEYAVSKAACGPPHPLLRQAARPARGQPAAVLGLRPARGSVAADAADRPARRARRAAAARRTRRSRATSSTATTSCDAFVAAASELREDDYGDSFNVGTGRQTTIGELAEVARELYGIEQPASFTMPAAALGRAATGTPTASARRSVLGWEARTPLEDGLERMTVVVPAAPEPGALPPRDQGGRARRRAQHHAR